MSKLNDGKWYDKLVEKYLAKKAKEFAIEHREEFKEDVKLFEFYQYIQASETQKVFYAVFDPSTAQKFDHRIGIIVRDMCFNMGMFAEYFEEG